MENQYMTESWIFAYTKCCASKHQQVFTFLIGVTNGPWRKPARNGLQADDKSMVAAGVAASRSERLLASQLSVYVLFVYRNARRMAQGVETIPP